MKSVSVVIPNYKKHPLVKYLPAVIKACSWAEIIVVDDASPDGAAEYLKKNFPQVKVIVNNVNERFAVSCNRGVKAARGEIVLLLNSDVAPKAGFLTPLLKHFEDKRVFAVSCLEIDNQGQFSGRNRCRFKRGLMIHAAGPVRSGSNCWATGGSAAFDRKKYLELGGMDPIYKPAYWEDIDLSWRARQRGWRVLFEPKARVFHHHETTNVTVFGHKQMELMALRNQLLFVWKNIRGWKLFEHFLWLPYHLTLTTWRTKGLFFRAFFQATSLWLK
jgi:GT2 family glycosyltransferase